MEAFELDAQQRTTTGRGENRRMRKQGRVPAVIYGGKGEPTLISVSHNELSHHLENEAFYSHIIKINIDGAGAQEAILRDLQRHPARPFVEHADFYRVTAGEKFRTSVPLRFIGEEKCVGVVDNGGIIERGITEVEIECLPRDLPEVIEIDITNLDVNESLHLADLIVPEGVQLVDLLAVEEGEEDITVVSVHLPRAEAAEDENEDAEESAGDETENNEE